MDSKKMWRLIKRASIIILPLAFVAMLALTFSVYGCVGDMTETTATSGICSMAGLRSIQLANWLLMGMMILSVAGIAVGAVKEK